MGGKRAKKYTPEFKKNAVRMVLEGDKAVSVVARELGVTYGALYEWVRQAEGRARPGHGAPLVEKTDEQREVDRLRKENEQLKTERDFLKKAAAFFAKQNG